MSWQPLPQDVPLDHETTPPPFTPPSAADAQSSDAGLAPLPANAELDAPAGTGFTDEQKRAIQAYIPKAKDAADLERYSLEISGGTSKVGNAAEVITARDKGTHPDSFAWADPTISNDLHRPAQPSPIEGAGRAFIAHIANAAAADYGPEVGAMIDKILNPSSDLSQDTEHERAILEGESTGHGTASTLGELTGMGLTAPLATKAVEAVPIVAQAAEAAPKLTAAGEGAAQGAAYGSGAAGPGNRAEGAITGAAVGAATPVVASKVADALASRAASNAAAAAENQDFAQAAGRQGIDYMAADLPSATKSKFATALSSLTLGGIPLAEQGAKNVGTAASAVERTASDIGSVTDKTGAGQAAQRGAQQFVGSTADTLNGLEQKIPIAAEAPANVANTRGALTNLAQSFKSNPKLAAAFADPRIKAYLDALTPQTTKEATGVLDAAGIPITRDVQHGGGLSWQDLRDFRSRVGEIIGQPGLASDGAQIGQLRALYGALSDDIRQTAGQYGPEAANAWSRWNNYARARQNRIENVVSLIMGPDNNKAPQSAFEALQRLAQNQGGDPLKLARALRSMPDDEANSVRATILNDLGHAPAGQQNDTGTAFSPAGFVTQWNKISARAKNVLFTGEHRQALDDLAKVFSGMKSSTKFANTSKTGIGVIASTHTVPAVLANPVLGALDMALQYGGGKLLASPSLARKIASTPLNKTGAIAFWSRPWVKQLQLRNPAIAGEIQAFQSAFLRAANDNIAPAAVASPEPDSQDQQQ